MDYYNVLEVHKNASIEELKKSYRNLAIQWHPDKNPNKKEEAEAKFKKIKEAYEVLKARHEGQNYDQHGEVGSNNMSPSGSRDDGEVDSEESMCDEFFGGSPLDFESASSKFMRCQPYGAWGFYGGSGRSPKPLFRSFNEGVGASGERQLSKAPTMESKLACSLEELYTGATREIKISRNVIASNGCVILEREILTIEVRPGWKSGTKITFPNKGNRPLNQHPADVVIVIDEKPHALFTRDGNDLIIHKKISQEEALAGMVVRLTSLDGRHLRIPVASVVSPMHELVVHKEGMPNWKNGEKGDLKIKFEVKFPFSLAVGQ